MDAPLPGGNRIRVRTLQVLKSLAFSSACAGRNNYAAKNSVQRLGLHPAETCVPLQQLLAHIRCYLGQDEERVETA